MQVEWTVIDENMETNELFNVNMFQLIPKEPTYTQFNQFVTKSSVMTGVATNRKNKCWFHHSQDILLPINKTRVVILTQCITLGIGKGDTSFTKQQLQNQQQEVNNAIFLEKTDW